MSVAFPDAIRERGRIHPTIAEAARFIMSLGWRVTSIWRPGGTHRDGISMDIAPLEYSGGGFGPKTTTLIWTRLHDRFPHQPWLVNAEYDHVHVQMYKFDALGRNTNQGTLIQRIML